MSNLLLSYVVPGKSKMEISQNFVAFSEYMNFTEIDFDTQNNLCNVWVKKTETIHSIVISHSSKSICVIKLSFCQNDYSNVFFFLLTLYVFNYIRVIQIMYCPLKLQS